MDPAGPCPPCSRLFRWSPTGCTPAATLRVCFCWCSFSDSRSGAQPRLYACRRPSPWNCGAPMNTMGIGGAMDNGMYPPLLVGAFYCFGDLLVNLCVAKFEGELRRRFNHDRC